MCESAAGVVGAQCQTPAEVTTTPSIAISNPNANPNANPVANPAFSFSEFGSVAFASIIDFSASVSFADLPESSNQVMSGGCDSSKIRFQCRGKTTTTVIYSIMVE